MPIDNSMNADAGHVDMPFENTDLVPLIEDALQRARAGAKSKCHRLEFQCAGGPFEIRGDRKSLRRLIWTLVDNAIKYTPEGGRVEILLEGTGSQVRLRVRDTGRGIPYHDLPHIFERFYVVDRSRSREHTGTGLGLSIARHLVEAHGGTLTAQSVYGRGATFVCRLPRVTEAAGATFLGKIKPS